MPTYEYVCGKCGHAFDFVQSMSSTPLRTCPKDVCPKKKWGKGVVKKQMGAGAGLIFKGSGFYITDYRSESYKDAAKKDIAPSAPATPAASTGSTAAATPATPAAAPAPAKTESKPAPASKPETKSKSRRK